MSTESVAPAPGFFRRRVVEPVLGQLRQGLAPEQLALTVALAASCGLVPVLGLTTLLGTAVAMWLRLNVATMLLVSHLMSPVQILILLPLMRFGAGLLGGPSAAQLTLARLKYLFTNDLAGAFQLFWRAELGALLLWLAGSVPVVLGLYWVLRPAFRRIVRRQAASPPSPFA
ncbi:DUF2062 domain-containing protein [Hymenobacter busanensis]|nr:DUF2062 domain-containing protein [Hymenobacter busanensis]QHJ06161.1 DUF2062 domain-containing protein [Hymenobacter busanensis]